MEGRGILMEITRGKIQGAKRVVIYGPEGIGKSTLASRFPDPLFSDTEGSTKELDVARLPAASSWQMLLDEARYVYEHPDICKTYVVDTADWAEMLAIKQVCSSAQKKGIEDFGYGKGYVYLKEEYGRWLNLLTDIVEKRNINVVITAHAMMRKFEQPDEMGAYDRWELKLNKQTAPLMKEWADLLLFANYKTYSVATDDSGKKYKAQGGRRVMYTSHHSCWDAKNRYGLPEEVPLEYASIRHIIEGGTTEKDRTEEPSIPTRTADIVVKNNLEAPYHEENTVPFDKSYQETIDFEEDKSRPVASPSPPESKEAREIDKALAALREIMSNYFVTDYDIQQAVAKKGYYPVDTPLENYLPDFVWGCLIQAWDKVYAEIQHKDDSQAGENPFENK